MDKADYAFSKLSVIAGRWRGPGLYAERFTAVGYMVTGIDFSGRSIGYARRSAQKAGLDIQYICQDYLTLDIGKLFDLSTMIYCDYGVL